MENAALEFHKGEEYVIIGDTTGVSEGIADEIRVETGGEMQCVQSVKRGVTFSMEHAGQVRRRDRLYRMTPLTSNV